MPQCHTTADHLDGGGMEKGETDVSFTGEDQEYNNALNFRDGSI